MKKKQWRKLVERICAQKVLPKLNRRRRKFHHMEMYEEIPYALDRLEKAMRVIRFIEHHFDDDQNVFQMFTAESLASTLQDLVSALHVLQRFTISTGVVDDIEEFYEEIVDGMSVDDFPTEDFALMESLGSASAYDDLELLVRRIKKKKEIIYRKQREGGFRIRIEEVEEKIETKIKFLKNIEKNTNEKPSVKRKWFKGLGSICTGTAMTILDVTLLTGSWTIQVPEQTKTVGALVSITTGFGSIMNGCSEPRGE